MAHSSRDQLAVVMYKFIVYLRDLCGDAGDAQPMLFHRRVQKLVISVDLSRKIQETKQKHQYVFI